MQRRLAVLPLLLLAACGDDGTTPTDAGDTGADADVATDVADANDDVTPDVARDVVADADVAEVDTTPEPTPAETATELTEPGPFNVGYRVFDWSYQAPWHAEPRVIPINVWYPTEDPLVGQGTFYIDTFPDRNVIVDASLAASVFGDSYPVHLHSHGSQGFGGTSAFMMRHFASHGWVAVAPDHVGNLLNDDIEPRPVATYLNRPRDLSEALDAVAGLSDGDPLAGVLDTDRVLLSGHSFGVYTVWAAIGADFDDALIADWCDTQGCTDEEEAGFLANLGDPRIVAAVGMAGTYRASFFGDAGHATVTAPFFAMTGSEDGPEGARQQYDERTGIDLRWIELEGGCHQSFALGGCATLANQRGFDVLDAYTLAFGREWVLGDTSTGVEAILTGEFVVDDEITTFYPVQAE